LDQKQTILEADFRKGSLASILTCQRHVRLDRNLGHAGGTGEEFRAGIQRSVDKGWLTRHESGTNVKFTPAGAEQRPGSSVWSSVLRDTDWTPSIVPGDEDRDVCLVVSD
jgi:hypothetical protein